MRLEGVTKNRDKLHLYTCVEFMDLLNSIENQHSVCRKRKNWYIDPKMLNRVQITKLNKVFFFSFMLMHFCLSVHSYKRKNKQNIDSILIPVTGMSMTAT